MPFLVLQNQPAISDKSFSWGGWGAELYKFWSVMDESSRVLDENPTPSDLDFMIEDDTLSFGSSTSSTRSDAESAPPELDQLFSKICERCDDCLERAEKQLPPEWNIPDLVRTVIGDEAIHMPSFLSDSYYDVMLHGSRSWLVEDLSNFVDLINYAPPV